jgi:cobalt-precorrin 5A hydrolase/precorrin-3B C17-methyltransferase
MSTIAIVILSESSAAIARQIQAALPHATLYGLGKRTQTTDVSYQQFSETVQELFTNGTSIVGICAAGILIRALAPLLSDKRMEPPVIAVAEDGSAVVPLLGGLTGANTLAQQIATTLGTQAATTATGQLRFNVVLESPPAGYRLLNPEHAKSFTSDLITGATVRLVGDAPWLRDSNLPFSANGTHLIEVMEPEDTEQAVMGSATHLVYRSVVPQGRLAIVGLGPGSPQWLSPEVKAILQSATDLVGYKTYLDLVGNLAKGKQHHQSDNRVELERARQALNLAATGKSVAVVSSGDPGIYAMAAAVFEVLDHDANPAWEKIEIQVAPGISAMQAAAAAVGAPLGHDFCAISLSDILKPWSVIEQRIIAAAQADFVIAFYNPVSKQRTWQLSTAQEILLQWRAPETPVILGRSLGRLSQAVEVTTLAQLKSEQVDMRTIVIVGSSTTRIIHRKDGRVWVYTPRHYA